MTRHQDYYLRLKLEGRCQACTEPAVSYRFCQEHLDEENARRRARWAAGPKRRSDDTPEARAPQRAPERSQEGRGALRKLR
jgi:hypothetical protein